MELTRRSAWCCLAALCIALPAPAAHARPRIGAPAPLPSLRDLQGTKRSLKELAGPRGIVLLFWATWSDRSLEELQRLSAAAAEIDGRGVVFAAVNVDRQMAADADLAGVRRQVSSLGVRMPVFVDDGLELFNQYGVVTVPSTALVDGDGRLAYFLYGYSHEQREELFDALDRLAGVKRMRSAGAPPPRAAAPAIRRLQLGRTQLGQGRVEAARASFERASQADADFPDPIVELVALAVDDEDVGRARALLKQAGALAPTDSGVRREGARLQAIEGRAADARAGLADLEKEGADALTSAYLAYMLHAAGETEAAAAAFDRAAKASGVDPRAFLRDRGVAVVDVARAMATYRRAVVSPRL
jgi:thioredoxin-like negative regulator of GroEL